MTRFARRKYQLTSLENEILLSLDDSGESELIPLIATLYDSGQMPRSVDIAASLGPVGIALRRLMTLGLVTIADGSARSTRGLPCLEPSRALEVTRLETWVCWDPAGFWRGRDEYFDTLILVRAKAQSENPFR